MTSRVDRKAAAVTDQAKQLRAMAAAQPPEPATRLPAIAVTGGKGGVGKSCIAVNLSIALAEIGLSPLLVDVDLGLANADVMLGINSQATLYEVLFEGKSLKQAVVAGPKGMSFLPAASGRDELTRLQPRQFQSLLRELARAAADHDLVVFDTAAGIGREVATFLGASRVILVVVTPEPTSLTDAYALIKVVERDHPGKDIRVLVNQATNQDLSLIHI